jgi:hypothetical protein
MNTGKNEEQKRLDDNAKKEVPLEKWGPYLSERQWGTVREDYSADGDAWNYFPHDHARSRAYLWGEDGIAGISDRMQDICFAVSMWNGKDPILKERLFGLNNHEGNHGEDVKELYYYLDNVPSHYYMKYLYNYPHQEYPYEDLIQKNAARSKQESEYEILDTGVFNDNRYFDVFISYAKNDAEDISIKIEVKNRGAATAAITLMPVLWFYNRWQYGGLTAKPTIKLAGDNCVQAVHERAGNYYFYFDKADDALFTENETNTEKLFGIGNKSAFVKDAFHDAIIYGKNRNLLRDRKEGTKFSPVYELNIAGQETAVIHLRLSDKELAAPFANADDIFEKRKAEADDFYADLIKTKDAVLVSVQRQAFAGLLWSKQYYHYDVERWLTGSYGHTVIYPGREAVRNGRWKTLKNQDVISMPDKWEYPWFAAWDTAFHSVSMALIDPVFAKNQLILLMREWYMSPEGQLPAYEWDFGDVNPPVHAFAALEIYNIEKKKNGTGDLNFLKKIFQKLIINFTWWVNRKDENGNNIFEGGFLGLDNISIFNRNVPLNSDVILEQTDGTAWMGMYALNMKDIALEIAMQDESFEDAATKFYEHFVIIAAALNELGLWHEEDSFFYDVLSITGKDPFPLKVRSVVGLTPLYAVSIIEHDKTDKLKDFVKRVRWYRNYRLQRNSYLPGEERHEGEDILLSLINKEKLATLLGSFLNEQEFLSPGGIRSLSKHYASNPYSLTIAACEFSIQYDPADSTSGLYGGNSNWRGPVWMPINYLFIKALEKYGSFYGDTLKVEFPSGSGVLHNLNEVTEMMKQRVASIFIKNSAGDRPVFGEYNWFYKDEGNDLVLFHEYFNGDTLKGLGASHQTGWTALLVNLLSE